MNNKKKLNTTKGSKENKNNKVRKVLLLYKKSTDYRAPK